MSPRTASNSFRKTAVPFTLLIGDTLATFSGLMLGWWIRYASPVAPSSDTGLYIPVPDATLGGYLPLILVGVALLLASFAQFGLYDTSLLLRRYQSLNAIIKGSSVWLIVYLGISLVLRFDPPISRLFAIIAFVCVIFLLYFWRSVAYAVVTRSAVIDRLRRRAVLLGWNDEAHSLASEIIRDPAHPFKLAGVVTLNGDSSAFVETAAGRPKDLGNVNDLAAILARETPDLLIITRLDLPRAELRRIVDACERNYVEWKVVPGAFDIFLSGLHLQTIGRVPLLGVEALAIDRLFNRALKRTVDIIGAIVGLIGSIPVVAVLAIMIKRESPNGPVFFLQTRIGADHRPFTVYKLRSMNPDAAKSDSQRQSTARDDPRLLRIGAVARKWNLDELPQFWNVLRGDMSLVGPRPERPYHVEKLAQDIPHYLPRHVVKPGMTGWAQVNGFRGESDLSARAQHDIYYIENWSIWLDVQILLLTFARWRNDSAY